MRRVIVSVLAFLFCLIGLVPVEALTITGLTVTLDCSSFSFSGFNYTFDRDNTGSGEEHYQIIVTDADDNVIHLVSGSIGLGPFTEGSGSGTYNLGTAVPGAVTYQWVSLAGNGLEEQIAYSTTGFCGDAPTATPTLTPTPTATAGPSPTPTPTITPTASIEDVYDVGGRDVLVVREVTPGDAAQVGLLTLIAGLLMIQIVRDFLKR